MNDFDQRLDALLAAAAPPARHDPAVDAAITELSSSAATRVRPRPRRSSRILIGVVVGVFALGGTTAAAAAIPHLFAPPPWVSSAEFTWDVTRSDGVTCSIATTVASANPNAGTPEGRGEDELAAAREILDDLDPTTLVPESPDTELSAYTSAISDAVWTGLEDRGVLAPGEASDIIVQSFIDCGDPE